MLVVARGPGQSVVIDERIVVTVLAAARGVVRLGVDAPSEVGVRRGELASRGDAAHRQPADVVSDADHVG